MKKELSIKGIESIRTENGVKNLFFLNGEPFEVVPFKDEFELIFADCGGYFGFSVFVFKNGKHLHYADNYELHYKWMNASRQELKEKFLEVLENKIFSEKELLEPTPDYTTQEQKAYYLRNYWIQEFEYISAFNIFHNDQEEKEFDERVKGLFYNPISFCYVEDKNIIDRQKALLDGMKKANAKSKETFDYWYNAFKHEMYNHEYPINWQADWDVLGCFFKVPWLGENPEKYFEFLKLSEMQKNAYLSARREVLKNCDY